MSSFTGVSVITDGNQCTTSAVDAGTDSGYHLLVVKDYSLTVKETPNGDSINSGPFMVGGHQWYIEYCPNGEEQSSAHFISIFIGRWGDDDEVEEAVEAKFEFSFVDEVEYQKPMYIRSIETCSFSSKGRLLGHPKFIKRDVFERSTHLKDDCFTIRCDIMVCKDNTQDVSATMSDVGQHFDNLLQNKVGADVTFEVSGETFAAHRCVLAARSTVFMAQLFGPMKEGTTSSVIQIKDIEAKVFAALLRFIYTDSFPEMDGDKEYVMWLQDLFVAADRYDLQRLKLLCEEELSDHIGVSSVASTLSVAEKHNCHRLKEACFKFIQVQSPKCLDKVMGTDGWEHLSTAYPSVLKEIISKLASNQKKDKKRKR